MPYDGITTRAVITELQKTLIGGKINKIFEPTKNEILLSIYNRETYILEISANPNYCRIHLTTHSKPNPQSAANFCMLLRKYLTGGKIIDISNYDLERTVRIQVECYNELNDLVVRNLYVQIMSRQSNIILTNENNIIIDCIKHSDNFLPAHPFEFAHISKQSFINLNTFDEFWKKIDQNSNLTSEISNKFIGFSKTFISKCFIDLSIDPQNYSEQDALKIYDYIKNIINNFGTSSISAINFEKDYVITLQNSNNFSINNFLDEYYFNEETQNNFLSSRNNLLKIVSTNLKKVYKKLENINEKLQECDNMEKYKLYGELLTANLYKLNPHENLTEITLENYYENNTPIKIPLDNKITIQKNIEKYFKKYNKLKNALIIVSKQKKDTEKELDYIESIVFSLNNAKSMNDINDIFIEISENIDLKKGKQKSSKKNKKNETDNIVNLQSIDYNGFKIYIGKNNIQNDYLSIRFANRNDIWFHTQKIHGSHVLLRNSENLEIDEIPEEILLKCATIAKENSKAKLSSNVFVDYCYAKFVKKSPGSKPGLVFYTNYKSFLVK